MVHFPLPHDHLGAMPEFLLAAYLRCVLNKTTHIYTSASTGIHCAVQRVCLNAFISFRTWRRPLVNPQIIPARTPARTRGSRTFPPAVVT